MPLGLPGPGEPELCKSDRTLICRQSDWVVTVGSAGGRGVVPLSSKDSYRCLPYDPGAKARRHSTPLAPRYAEGPTRTLQEASSSARQRMPEIGGFRTSLPAQRMATLS